MNPETPTRYVPCRGEGEASNHLLKSYWYCGGMPIVILPCAVLAAFPASWSRWAFMWTLAFAFYAGCKWLTWRRTAAPAAAPWKHLAYLLAWPGMDAAAFLSPETSLTLCRPSEWVFASAKLLGGTLLLWVAVRFVPDDQESLKGWIRMIGLVMSFQYLCCHFLGYPLSSAGILRRDVTSQDLVAEVRILRLDVHVPVFCGHLQMGGCASMISAMMLLARLWDGWCGTLRGASNSCCRSIANSINVRLGCSPPRYGRLEVHAFMRTSERWKLWA